MQVEDLIPIEQLCAQYEVESLFFEQTEALGLIEFKTIDGNRCISTDQIKDIETIIVLHFELEINMEGIEAIFHLLNKLNALQNELFILKSRLKNYEEID